MEISFLTGEDEEAAVGAWIAEQPQGSLWQSPAWAQYQRALGREARFLVARENGEILASALMIRSGSRTIFDEQVPRGPVFREGLEEKEKKDFLCALLAAGGPDPLAMYLSPPESLPQAPELQLEPSGRHEQPEATILLDLTLPDEALLAQMKPKGRYNIGLAQRHGVTVEQSRDIPAFARLSQETAARDGFITPSERQYELFLRYIPGSFLLLAFPPVSPQNTHPAPIAGLLGVVCGQTGIYYYGASSSDPAYRPLMAPYLLQWEAMCFCKAQGAPVYDLLGIAPPEAGVSHPWAGVTDFKKKFGGRVKTYPAEVMRVFRPWRLRAIRAKRRLLG